MANVQNLQEKVKKATEKVEKCKGTIVRHEKQLDKKIVTLEKQGINLRGLNKIEIEKVREPYRSTDLSWEIYEVTSKLEDIKGATRKLKDAEIVLSNWQLKLDEEVMKDEFINNHIPQVIKDFLEQWRQKAYGWHIKKYNDYLTLKKELYQKESDALKEIGVLPYRERRAKLEELELNNIEGRLARFGGAVVVNMSTYRDETERLAYLEKVLKEDVKAKSLDLINRINAVVGTITDARALSVDVYGNLNGVIKGEKGTAKVETIGAGGYNIQCFHYRTLVHKY